MESSIIGYSRGDYSAKTFQAVNPANGEKLMPTMHLQQILMLPRLREMAADAAMQMAVLMGRRKPFSSGVSQMELMRSQIKL